MIDRKFKILILVLVLVLIINTIVHFTSPAYRFYNSSVSTFRSDYNDFVRQVRTEFVPAILSVSSNSVFRSNSTNSLTSLVASDPIQIPSSVDVRYFSASGRGYFEWRGRSFTSGDDFFGYTILDVRPTIIITDQRIFLIGQPSDNSKHKDNIPCPPTTLFPSVTPSL